MWRHRRRCPRTFRHLSVACAKAGSRHADVTGERHSEVASTRNDEELLTGVVATGRPDEVSRNVATVVELNTHSYCDTHEPLQLDRQWCAWRGESLPFSLRPWIAERVKTIN